MTRHPVQPLRCDPRHSWLAALLPVDARRLRVEDSELRKTLADAGAELVDDRADVAIVPPWRVRASAPHVLAPLGRAGEPSLEGWPRSVRGARRAVVSAGVRAAATAAAARLRRRGFPLTRVVFWDVERPLGGGRLPLGAVVAADRRERPIRLLEAIGAEAGAFDGVPTRVGSWGVVAVGAESVLRVAVGPGRRILETQARALDLLLGSDVGREFSDVIPWLTGRGTTGLGEWSVERRLPGSPVASEPPDRALADCLELVGALDRLECARGRCALTEAAAIVAPFAADLEPRVRALGEHLDARLSELPTTFAHGDLSPANLLVRGDRLTGVVDWNKAGGGRARLHDLLNLRLALEMERTGSTFGNAFAERLLPLLHAGGDHLIRSHCARIGLDASSHLLVALASAYWLDRVAGQLRTYADRSRRRGWLRDNVVRPAAAVVGAARL